MLALFAIATTAMAEGDATWSVRLDKAGDQKLNVIKVVKEDLGLGLKEAKDLVESAPCMLLENVEEELAKAFAKKLHSLGATVTLLHNGIEVALDDDGSLWSVWLDEVGSQKLEVVKVVKEDLGLGLKEAKDLVDSAPCMLLENVEKERAEALAQKLRDLGATVTLIGAQTYELKLEPGLTIMTVSTMDDFAALWMAAMADVFNVESSKETGAVFKSKKTGKKLMIAGEGIVWVSADVTPEDNVTFDIPAAGRAELIKEFGEDLLSDYGKVTLSFVALPEKKDLTLSFPKKENTLEELNISEGSMEGFALYALLYWEKLQSFEDDDTGDLVFATMSGKNLFEMIDDKIIVCDGVTSADNIVYTITDKNREDFMKGMEMPFDIFTAYKTIQIKFEFGTTGIGAPLNDNGQRTNDSWYTIDGKKLQGEPTKKGVYIIKGKKIVK